MAKQTLTLALLVFLAVAGDAGALGFDFVASYEVGPFGPDAQSTLQGVAVRSNGNLLAVDSLDDQIYEMNSAGVLQGSIDLSPALCGQLLQPPCIDFVADIAVASNGDIWLIDGSSPTGLHHLDSTGTYIEGFDVGGSVISPGGLAFDPRNGDVLASDFGFDEITRFDAADFENSLLTEIYSVSNSTAPHGVVPFGTTGIFMVVDLIDATLYEYRLPTGAGSSTPDGQTVLSGYDFSGALLSGGAYDPSTQTLYLTDDSAGGRVLEFTFVPEPASAALTGLGLLALAALRRRAR